MVCVRASDDGRIFLGGAGEHSAHPHTQTHIRTAGSIPCPRSSGGAHCQGALPNAPAFPTRARATCHGISAASGKAGAAIGSAAFPIILAAFSTQQEGVSAVLYICAALSVLGFAWTWVFTRETGGVDLAELDAENERRLVAQG